MTLCDIIEQRLQVAFDPNLLKVIDDSHKHQGHAGNTGGGHFTIEISAECFKGKSRIQSHRMIYQSVDDLIQTKQIHALSLIVKT
jgi:BolA protein